MTVDGSGRFTPEPDPEPEPDPAPEGALGASEDGSIGSFTRGSWGALGALGAEAFGRETPEPSPLRAPLSRGADGAVEEVDPPVDLEGVDVPLEVDVVLEAPAGARTRRALLR